MVNFKLIDGKEFDDGVILKQYNPETTEISYKKIHFNNYFYIRKIDYEQYKDELYNIYKYHIYKTQSNNEYTKIIFSHNIARHNLRRWFEEVCLINTYEADIDAFKRYLIDNTSDYEFVGNEATVLYFDIETDDRLDLEFNDYNVVKAKSEILSFSGYDTAGESYFVMNTGNEKEMLTQIRDIMEKYCIVSSYNGDTFDFPYIIQRMNNRQIPNKFDMLNHIDFLASIKKNSFAEYESYKLDDVAYKMLDLRKIEVAKGGGRIYNLWQENPKLLEEYNMWDSYLILKLNNVMHLIEIHISQSKICSCPVKYTIKNTVSNDYITLINMKKMCHISKSKPNTSQRNIIKNYIKKYGSIGGGHTVGMNVGFRKNVKVFDFKSFYPTLICTFDISPETFVCNAILKENLSKYDGDMDNMKVFDTKEQLLLFIKSNKYIYTPDDTSIKPKTNKKVYHPHRIYKNTVLGVMPMIMKSMITERDKTKYTMKQYKDSDPDKYFSMHMLEWGIKIQANSMYGFLLYIGSRYFNYHVGDSITASARYIMKKIIKKIKSLGLLPIFTDTDSIAIYDEHNKYTIDQLNMILYNYIDEMMLEFGVSNQMFNINHKHPLTGEMVNKNHWIVLEYEKEYPVLLYCKKKHYAYLKDGKIGITGLECRKSDTNKLSAKLQYELIEDILFERFDAVKFKDKLIKLKIDCYNNAIDKKMLIFTKGLNKSKEGYEGYVIDSKTGKPKIKKDGSIQKKSLPCYVILSEEMKSSGCQVFVGDKIPYIIKSSKPRQTAITPEEFEKNGIYDKKYYWQVFTKPLIKILRYYDDKYISKDKNYIYNLEWHNLWDVKQTPIIGNDWF